jgi:hypothetical protein
MTVVDERVVGHDEAIPTAVRPGRSRRFRAVAAAVLVVVLIAGAVLAWVLTAASARNAVVILADQHSLTCSPSSAATTTTTEVENDNQAPLTVPTIRLSGPASCKMTFVIDNTGTSVVTVNAVHLAPMLPLTGLRTGAVGQVGAIDGSFQLAPDEAVSVDIGLAWQHGCLASHGTDTDSGTPTLSITAEGLSGTISKPGPSYAVLGTTYSEAHCPWKK